VEFVIVDDGSTDETPELLATFQQSAGVPVTILAGPRRGVAAARNLASEHAAGRWLASFDDDQLAEHGWLAALRTLAEETGAACVSGALALQLPPDRSLAELGPRVRGILGEHLDGDVPKFGGIDPASNNVLIRRDVFLAMHGYDTSFTEGAEDADLFDRIGNAGYSIWFQPEARALHITPATRLSRSNLRWTSLRLGASDARRFARRGTLHLLGLACLRLGTTLLRDLPLLTFAVLTRNLRLKTDVQCSLWYTTGLLRALPAFMVGKPGDSAFLRSLDFRARNGERKETALRSTNEQ
jgi:GT2 family glycosyltransferase